MKKIITTALILATATASFAQDKIDPPNAQQNSKNEYYIMQGEYMVRYSVHIITDTIYKDTPLRNGKSLNTRAELFRRNGKKIFLNDGECVDSKGKIKDCTLLKKKLDDRQQEITQR